MRYSNSIKVTIDSYNDNGDMVPFEFTFSESDDKATVVINGKKYWIDKDNIMRLGAMSKPLTYREPSSNNTWSDAIKYY